MAILIDFLVAVKVQENIEFSSKAEVSFLPPPHHQAQEQVWIHKQLLILP